MSKFYVIIESGGLVDLVEKVWCDNLDCLYYAGRNGIPRIGELSSDDGEVLSIGGKNFCSQRCEEQAPEAEARYASAVRPEFLPE